ncbi:MAG: site-2 protease family protein [Planctomycetota bacterium]|nr:site-2 protease family protein [Planctomycetota bacterium]
MKDSFRLGQLFGITIRVHHLVVVLLGLMLLLDFGRLAVVAYLLLCPIVLLHELGHSLVARRFGIEVIDITFWPLGGMARMRQIPEDSRIEGLIAVAGPAVNLALALLAAPFTLFTGGVAWEVAMTFVAINALMGSFNLVPAFPMDGGRLLRAWLGRHGDWLAATERAVRVGRTMAVAMFVVTLLPGQPFFLSPMLPLIAIFVWWTGRQELLAVRLRHGQQTINIGPFSFVVPGAAERGPRDVSARDVPGAETAGQNQAGGRRRAPGGFSAEQLQRLERFRGRLGQFRGGGDAPPD